MVNCWYNMWISYIMILFDKSKSTLHNRMQLVTFFLQTISLIWIILISQHKVPLNMETLFTCRDSSSWKYRSCANTVHHPPLSMCPYYSLRQHYSCNDNVHHKSNDHSSDIVYIPYSSSIFSLNYIGSIAKHKQRLAKGISQKSDIDFTSGKN